MRLMDSLKLNLYDIPFVIQNLRAFNWGVSRFFSHCNTGYIFSRCKQ